MPPEPHRRKARQGERREAHRARILEVSSELFFRRGYAGTTVDAICDALNVTKPYVYWYFADKAEIAETLSLEAAEMTLRAISSASRSDKTPVDTLRDGLRAMMDSHVRLFKAGALYYREPGVLSEDVRSSIRIMARGFHRELVSLIETAIDAEQLPPQDARLTAMAIGGIAGFMYTWYDPEGPLRPEEVADALTLSMMRAAGATVERR